MLSWATLLFTWMRSLCRTRRALVLENMALRQQLSMLQRTTKRARPTRADRLFWVAFSRCVVGWRTMLHTLHPDTVVRWHREGFRRYWTRKSRRAGRPGISPNLRMLIREMQSANTGWGAPRIHGELLKLGFAVSQATVSKYMERRQKPPSQTWRTFLNNHTKDTVGIDFFVVPTATFRVLYVFVVLQHARRHIVHFNVTKHPTAQWSAQQIVEAFPFESAPRYMIRDRDSIYGAVFTRRVASVGVEEVIAAPRSPWQNPYVERVIGSLRRECFDHVIVINERHARRLMHSYVDYYHGSRSHLGLEKDSPDERPIARENGNVVAFPKVGGLHHHYERLAA